MEIWKRALLAAAILLLDTAVFFVPLTAIFLAYILLFNPPWARTFLKGLQKLVKLGLAVTHLLQFFNSGARNPGV